MAIPVIFGVVTAVGMGVNYVLSQHINDDPPRPTIRNPTTLPVGAIGWTQDSVLPRVYNVTSGNSVELQGVVDSALNAPEGAAAFLRNTFPEPIRVYYHPNYGYLSLDNRRLTIFHMALPSHEMIPVRILTEEEAGNELAAIHRRPDADQMSGSYALARRLTTRNGGFQILIRTQERPRPAASQGVCYVHSPYLIESDC